MPRQFTILNPCTRRWDELPGTGRARYCDACQTPVHDVHQYSRDEWEQLRRESGGRVCGYLAGAITTAQPSRRAWLVGALLTAVSPVMAQSGRVRFQIIDISGAVVPGADIALLEADEMPVANNHSDGKGEYLWTGLQIGLSRFAVNSPGFQTERLAVRVRNAREIRIQATLRLPTLGETVEIPEIVLDPAKQWWKRWFFF